MARETLNLRAVLFFREGLFLERHMDTRLTDKSGGLFLRLSGDEIFDTALGRHHRIDEAAAHCLRKLLHRFQRDAALSFRAFGLRNAGPSDAKSTRKLCPGHAKRLACCGDPAIAGCGNAREGRGLLHDGAILPGCETFD